MKNKLLDVTNDYVFKRIFGRTGNEDITRSFLKAATGIEFNKINLEDTPILERDLIENKMGILDVKIVADYINNIDIEMQVVKDKISQDQRERRLAELREKEAVRDEKAIRDSGFLEGRVTGLKEGIQEEKINIAREMLKEN